MGVDRLDYTKGIPRRLLSYEKMLQTHPELRERVRLVQVAVPSRTGVERIRSSARWWRGWWDESTETSVPRLGAGELHLPRLAEPELVALYRAAEVMLVPRFATG